MTGDESYHAACFTCRSCHMRIEELVFAKTSQGIYCMKCHNERVARSRRHAEKRSKAAKQREQQLARAAAQASGSASSESKDSTLSPSGEINRSASPSRTEAASPALGRSSGDGRNGFAEDSTGSVTSPETIDGNFSDGTPRSKGTPSLPSKDLILDSPAVSSSSEAWGNSSPSMAASNRLGAGSAGVGPRPGSAGQGTPVKKTPPTLRELRGGAGPAYGNASRDRAGSSSAVPPSAPGHQLSHHQSNGSTSQLHPSETAPASLDGLSDSHSRSISLDRNDGSCSATTVNSGPPASSSSPALGPSSVDNLNPVGLGIGPPLKSPQTSTPTVTIKIASSPTTEGPDSSSSKKNSHFSMDSEADLDLPTSVQLKRASRLSMHDMQGLGVKSDDEPTSTALRRSSKTYSFYDPDFINLMDSFGQFDSTDDFKLHSPKSPLDARKKSAEGLSPPASSKALNRISVQLTPPQDDGASISESTTASSNLTRVDENREKDMDDEAEFLDQDENRKSTSSFNTISAKMRESMKAAKGGHISMDTSFVESILQDLDDTKQRMKELQSKFDRIKRRSQQAAQGFSMAKQDFHAEVQARHQAELEMAALKRQLIEQASKLTSMATEKKQQEHLHRRSKEVRSTLQGMERDLAKLTVERDLTVAEVAELVALQDGSSPLPKDINLTPESANGVGGSSLTRNLSVRLDGVKEKYRKEIDELTFERDALLIEIEELKQSKEVFLEETHALNARNDELSSIMSQLTRRVDIANQSHGLPKPPSSSGNGSARTGSAQGNGGGFGFGFGKQHNKGVGSPSGQDGGTYPSAAAAASSDTNPTAFDTTVQRAFKPEKIEPAPTAKKFKWMKPKLTDTAKSVASALPLGHSPPVPPKSAGSLNSTGMGTSISNQGGSLSASSPVPQQSGLQVSSSPARASSNEIVVREHLFQSFNVLRPIRCFACQKNMWGQSEVRCALCGQACHQRCLQNLPTSCNQPFSRGDENVEPAGPSMFGKDLVEQVAYEGSEIPLVVEKCIQAVEKLGEYFESESDPPLAEGRCIVC